MMKTRAFDFAMFVMAAELTGIWYVFQQRIYIRNIDLIITKLENHLDTGHHNSNIYLLENISLFRVKMRSLKFVISLPNLSHILECICSAQQADQDFWPPGNDSCHVTNTCFRIGQRGSYDWSIGYRQIQPLLFFLPCHMA